MVEDVYKRQYYMYHMEYEAGHSNVDDGPVIQCVVFNADPFLFHFFLLSYCSFKNSLVNICTKIESSSNDKRKINRKGGHL